MVFDPISFLFRIKRALKVRIRDTASEIRSSSDTLRELLPRSIPNEHYALIQKIRTKVRSGRILRGLPRGPTFRRTLRGAAVVVIFPLLLSFGTSQLAPADNGGEKLSVLRPTLFDNSPLPPKISAKSAYILDLESGFVFYDKNSLLQLPPASTTKIATALTALGNYRLDEAVIVPPSCVLRTGESIMGLHSLEKIAVRDLLQGLLIASAGDAACALAAHHPEGMLEFIGRMNALVASLGLEHTYFVNPTGMDSTHQYSTAQELTLLAEEALESSFIREVVAMKETTVASVDGKIWHYLKSTNELLGEMPGILGVKTGYTVKAREVFIFYLRRDGKEVLGTVMGSDDRFAEAEKLLQWILASFDFY